MTRYKLHPAYVVGTALLMIGKPLRVLGYRISDWAWAMTDKGADIRHHVRCDKDLKR